jgi:hypothetical protein
VIASMLETIISYLSVDVRIVSRNTSASFSGVYSDVIALKTQQSLMDAIAAAKIPGTADIRHVTVRRNGQLVPLSTTAAVTVFDIRAMRASGESGPLLEPGDVITVPSSR